MELRVLRYFLAVATAQSVSGAAEALNITQPTLSRQLMDLEQELGVKETLIKSVCGACRRFSAASALQKLEIHKVFLRFCALMRRKNARQSLLPDLISVSLNSFTVDGGTIL